MKRCFKCGVERELSEFYPHPQMADGHLNKCKECAKRDVIENRTKRLEYYQGYDRERSQSTDRKVSALGYQSKRRRKRPDRYRAYEAVDQAIKIGTLVRKPCEICGTTLRVEAHHDDYSKPLDVRWLCFKHHRAVHGQIVLPS